MTFLKPLGQLFILTPKKPNKFSFPIFWWFQWFRFYSNFFFFFFNLENNSNKPIERRVTFNHQDFTSNGNENILNAENCS